MQLRKKHYQGAFDFLHNARWTHRKLIYKMYIYTMYTQHNLFAKEREDEQLLFGTGAFHSYVHEWGCQLQYNPRINLGWGMSDGEGLERDWGVISPDIAPFRYSSKIHRINGLFLKLIYLNESLLNSAGT